MILTCIYVMALITHYLAIWSSYDQLLLPRSVWQSLITRIMQHWRCPSSFGPWAMMSALIHLLIDWSWDGGVESSWFRVLRGACSLMQFCLQWIWCGMLQIKKWWWAINIRRNVYEIELNRLTRGGCIYGECCRSDVTLIHFEGLVYPSYGTPRCNFGCTQSCDKGTQIRVQPH